jgi:hypothetical protein
MSNGHLIVHCGARHVDLDELAKVPAPPATDTWFPLKHIDVLNRVEATLAQSSFFVKRRQLALSRADARFFGTLDLESPVGRHVTLAVGVRNSVDKSLPIGMVAGSRVFVCDNLSFRSEILVVRKHTRNGETRFGEAICKAVQTLEQFRQAEAARIAAMEQLSISNVEAESLMLRAYERGIVSHRQLPRIIREWREPSFGEFEDRTLWSLFNGFTAILGERQKTNPQ